MSAFSYSDSDLPIRADLPEAYRFAWKEVSRAGCWWTGAERIAIAREVRNARDCRLCADRKEAVSPFAVDGQHDHSDGLPDPAIDTVHRLVSDASRLTKSWLEKLHASGVSDGHYVELLGIVVAVQSVDAFGRALGLALEPLPEATPGLPSGYRPDQLQTGDGWVPMLRGTAAGTAEADLFDGRQGPNVIRAMSLVPDAVRLLKILSAAQYMKDFEVADPAADPGRALTRPQIELVAGRVAALNECFY
ncbi:MAG: hypothetical protein GY725_10135 [bacterium]|nr:hypothetical protein [bacterium]